MSQVTTPQPEKEVGSNEQLPQLPPLVRVIAMPADANPNGDIFGGWLLSQMDLAGGAVWPRSALGDDARRWQSMAWFSTSRCSSATK